MKTIIVLLAALILVSACRNWQGDLREEIEKEAEGREWVIK